MANKRQAEQAIAEFGGAIDWDVSFISGSEKSVMIDAPDGFIWDYSQSEVIAIIWYDGPASEFWDEVIYTVDHGIQEV